MANENEIDDFSPQPEPFPKDLVADPESRTIANHVRDYLWGKGPVDYENVSAHMKRSQVLRCIEFECRALPPMFYWRVRILADLYGLRELLGPLSEKLRRAEAEPDDLDRSIATTIMMRELGDPQMTVGAASYYEYLVGHQHSGQKVQEMIHCLAAFGPDLRPDSLRSRIDREVRGLAQREAGEPELGAERRHIEELALNQLFFVNESNRSRARIDAITPSDARLMELIKAYLYLTEDDGGEYFELWVHQQIRRVSEAEGNETVVRAFREILSQLDRFSGADKKFCRVRCLKAIDAFEGKLDEAETEFLAKSRYSQLDPLQRITIPIDYEDPDDHGDGPKGAEEDEEDDEEEAA